MKNNFLHEEILKQIYVDHFRHHFDQVRGVLKITPMLCVKPRTFIFLPLYRWYEGTTERKNMPQALHKALEGLLSRFIVENILKGSLDSIPSPSPSVKIWIMGGKVCLMYKGKTLLGDVNKLFVFKSLLTSPSNVLPY